MIVSMYGEKSELYSPEGKCNFKLAKTPISHLNPVLVFTNNRIIACGGKTSCWEYNIQQDVWFKLVEANFQAEQQPGVVLKDKLYVIDQSNVHVLDLISNTWSMGPKPPKYFGSLSWIVGWKDSIILLGGQETKGVQIFNVTSQTWTVKNSTNVPMDMQWSSSLLIGPDEILIAGSWLSSPHSAAKYYPQTDSWLKLPDSQVSHQGSRLVQLGHRIFVIDGRDTDTVEEFFATNNTWSLIGVRLIQQFDGHHSVVALPSSLFAHLPGGCHGVY